MSFIDKGIAHVRKMFPEIYASREVRGSYHFSIAFRRNSLIAVGVNKPERDDARSFRLARLHNLTSKQLWPRLHSEEDLVCRLISLDRLSSDLNILVVRLNRHLELGESLPCVNCQVVLSAYGLNRVWYSTREGRIERL